MLLGGVATEVATATQVGQVTFDITQDPEFVVAATPPTIPASITATQVSQNNSTVTWTAPASTGGAPITGYTVTASPGGATCTTTQLSCEISGLSSGVDYTYSVIATNAIGASVSRQATIAYVPIPVININPTPPVSTPSTGTAVSAPVDRAAYSSPQTIESTATASPVSTAAPEALSETENDSAEATPTDTQSAQSQPFDPIGLLWIVLGGLVIAFIVLLASRRRPRN